MAELVRTGLVYGNSLSCLVYLLGWGFVPFLLISVMCDFCAFLKLCNFLFGFSRLYAYFKEPSKLLVEYGCISPFFFPVAPWVTRAAVCAKGRAELLCVCRCLGCGCRLEFVCSSAECPEWSVILVLFAKWNWSFELTKFERKGRKLNWNNVCFVLFSLWVSDSWALSLFLRLFWHRPLLSSPICNCWGVRAHVCSASPWYFSTSCLFNRHNCWALSWAGLVSIFCPQLRAVSGINKIGFFSSSCNCVQRLLGKSMEEMPRLHVLLGRIRFNSEDFHLFMLSKVCSDQHVK